MFFRTVAAVLIPLHHLLEPVVPLIALISGVAFTERFSFISVFLLRLGIRTSSRLGSILTGVTITPFVRLICIGPNAFVVIHLAKLAGNAFKRFGFVPAGLLVVLGTPFNVHHIRSLRNVTIGVELLHDAPLCNTRIGVYADASDLNTANAIALNKTIRIIECLDGHMAQGPDFRTTGSAVFSAGCTGFSTGFTRCGKGITTRCISIELRAIHRRLFHTLLMNRRAILYCGAITVIGAVCIPIEAILTIVLCGLLFPFGSVCIRTGGSLCRSSLTNSAFIAGARICETHCVIALSFRCSSCACGSTFVIGERIANVGRIIAATLILYCGSSSAAVGITTTAGST